ncbi:hypothetical protein MTO96_040538 [Rhipicephalus appendiculatus]
MTSANLVQACLEPTYSSRDGTSSSLDLAFVADPTRVTSCTTSEGLSNSDHRAIEVCYAAVLPRNGYHARQLWKFDQTDHTHLARLAHLAPWCMTSSGDDCIGNYELWCDMASAIQRECVPSCTRTSQAKTPPVDHSRNHEGSETKTTAVSEGLPDTVPHHFPTVEGPPTLPQGSDPRRASALHHQGS